MTRPLLLSPPLRFLAAGSLPISLALVGVLVSLACLLSAFAVGCGGVATTSPPVRTTGPGPSGLGPAPSQSAPSASAPTASASAVPLSVGSPTSVPGGAPAPAEAVEMKAPIPTALAAELLANGIDPQSLPPIEKLEPRALRGVMKLVARSLGIRCHDCHVEGDFAAPTPRKRIAAKMWDELAAKVTLADGAPVFCDSCHQGRIKLLDRTDKKALATWMDASFVDQLKRKDGTTEECESCHVDMDMRFLAKWAVGTGGAGGQALQPGAKRQPEKQPSQSRQRKERN